jgi:prophage regulatory protein
MQTNTTHPPRLLRLPDVQHQCGIGRSAIYARIAAGKFPAPIKLGARTSRWPAATIDAWIQKQIDAQGAA